VSYEAFDDELHATEDHCDAGVGHCWRTVALLVVVFHRWLGTGTSTARLFRRPAKLPGSGSYSCLALVGAGTHLLSEDAAKRVIGCELSLVCAGALFILGALDVSFNIQHAIYTTLLGDTLLIMAVNVWCMGFALLLLFDFGVHRPPRQ
jgi:hypothetical protein